MTLSRMELLRVYDACHEQARIKRELSLDTAGSLSDSFKAEAYQLIAIAEKIAKEIER